MALMLECFDRVGCGRFLDRVFWFTTSSSDWSHTSLFDDDGPLQLGLRYQEWVPEPSIPLGERFHVLLPRLS